jgi:thiamine monophosphate synthase
MEADVGRASHLAMAINYPPSLAIGGLDIDRVKQLTFRLTFP